MVATTIVDKCKDCSAGTKTAAQSNSRLIDVTLHRLDFVTNSCVLTRFTKLLLSEFYNLVYILSLKNIDLLD